MHVYICAYSMDQCDSLLNKTSLLMDPLNKVSDYFALSLFNRHCFSTYTLQTYTISVKVKNSHKSTRENCVCVRVCVRESVCACVCM